MKDILKALRQRSTWVGIAGVGTGVALVLGGNVDTGIQTIVGGLAVVFIREAIAKK